MKKNLFISLIAILGTFACETQAAKLQVFKDQNELLTSAIRSGSVSGIMKGDVGDLFTKQFKSNGDLMVAANVIKHFKRPDCKRIEVTYTKKNVVTPPGKTDAILKVQVNYCLDGQPPTPTEQE